MKIIYNRIFLEHNLPSHPENADRLKYFKILPDSEIPNGEEFLQLVHPKEYIEEVKNASEEGSPLDADTYTCSKSYEVACYAAGATIKASEQKAFALVRPPGHHASSSKAGGFCLFNNIAIAAKNLLQHGKRVFIIDFDLHHGNGTQEIFFGKNNIIYFSTHQSPCYPGTGLRSDVNCINVPLPYGIKDGQYIKELEGKLIPAINEFNPDVVAISAGFDCYYKDKDALGFGLGFDLTKKSFEKIKEIIKPFKHFFVLEGGYRPESIKKGVDIFTK